MNKRAADICRVDESGSISYMYYSELYKQFGEVCVEQELGKWQGDTLVLLKDQGRFGYLVFGWGSCSGCDALEACGSVEDVQNLMDSLESSIQWFDNVEHAITFFTTHDWEGDYLYYYKEELQKFISASIEYLKGTC